MVNSKHSTNSRDHTSRDHTHTLIAEDIPAEDHQLKDIPAEDIPADGHTTPSHNQLAISESAQPRPRNISEFYPEFPLIWHQLRVKSITE